MYQLDLGFRSFPSWRSVKNIFTFLKKSSEESEEDDVDASKSIERSEEEITAGLSDVALNNEELSQEINKLFYKRLSRHYLADEVRKENRNATLTSAAYHKQTRILVTGKFVFLKYFL